MQFPLRSFLADLQELDLILEQIVITHTFVFVKIEHLFLARVAELASARCYCVFLCFLPKYWQGFAPQALRIDERQREILLVDGRQHVEPFLANHAGLLALVV